MGLWYPKGSSFGLTAFLDADHTGCIDTRKSTSGGIQFLCDKLVSWMSKKQDYTAMSSAEAEYVALSASCAQVMWIRTHLQDYGHNYNKIPLYYDSQSTIAISYNPVQHSCTKHIHTRYHFIKEQVKNGIIELYFVRTEYQLADMFTKALPEDRFKFLVRRIEHPSDTYVFTVKMEILLEPSLKSSWVVQGRKNRGQGNNARGAGGAGYGGAQNIVGNSNPSQAMQIKCYNYNDKMLLMQAQENRVALDEEQLLFIVGGQDNAIDEDVDEQPAPTAQTMFMENLSSIDPIYNEASPLYDSDILSEVPNHDNYKDADCEHHEVHEMHDDVQPNYVVDSHTDYENDSNMISYDQYAEDNLYKEDQSLQTVHMLCKPKSYYDEQNKVAIGYKNPLYLTRAQQVQPSLYNGHEIIKTNHVLNLVHNSKDTLEIAEITRKKMKDPNCVKKKVKIAPHDYSKENYFVTFTP
uniref:Retrovirus-related Pol polyprotein from transposon TNT 1-94 n=1 Tax=Tanacetum cinerariifolium TaxID=118510 RepID=A0A699GW36_TANCI|nr:retrovirus-related Pol polyprotein from transposon TNT 1-94 [Tanacetum cinerariifolium]